MKTRPDDFGLNSRGENRQFQLRDSRPEVAHHCARMIVKHAMDYDAAASAMLKARDPEAPDADIVSLGRKLEKSRHIQREIKAVLEEIGYGDNALKTYMGLLWDAALDKKNDRRWPAAMRILQEILASTKKKGEDKDIPTLRIAGAEECVRGMLGDLTPSNTSDPDVPSLPDLDTMEIDGNDTDIDGSFEDGD